MIEYKVINTTQTGVPSGGVFDQGYKPDYEERLQGGLDDLGRHGWILSVVVGRYFIFYREKRSGKKKGGH